MMIVEESTLNHAVSLEACDQNDSDVKDSRNYEVDRYVRVMATSRSIIAKVCFGMKLWTPEYLDMFDTYILSLGLCPGSTRAPTRIYFVWHEENV